MYSFTRTSSDTLVPVYFIIIIKKNLGSKVGTGKTKVL